MLYFLSTDMASCIPLEPALVHALIDMAGTETGAEKYFYFWYVIYVEYMYAWGIIAVQYIHTISYLFHVESFHSGHYGHHTRIHCNVVCASIEIQIISHPF